MHLRSRAIICSVRQHGETAVIARLLTGDNGLIAVYVAGGRGRQLRPVMIPGNLVAAEINARSSQQLPWARIELEASRGPWLNEPLPAAAIGWVTALTATALPERHAYPVLFETACAVLDAICMAPSARGWMSSLIGYELLVLRELGYGDPVLRPASEAWPDMLASFDAVGIRLERYLLADRRGDAMAARVLLRGRLARIGG
jgi:DNA repair protein RecO (recombination protein O)